ncbi:hypothetical protein DSO57_1005807 [Entomophthora muscae]|uniref:Uncharacterized protein n=1 Tax=Entomophthora muscae TaxID=34485 RepID=A0ACC2TIS2_9FUNG|nr:hypothetical protein DSO57_1005807 [Entomophthora muscae]
MKRSFKYLKQSGATIITLSGLEFPEDYISSGNLLIEANIPVQRHMVCEFGHDIQDYLKYDVIYGPHSLPNIRHVPSIIEWYENYPLSKYYSLAPLRKRIPRLVARKCSATLITSKKHEPT